MRHVQYSHTQHRWVLDHLKMILAYEKYASTNHTTYFTFYTLPITLRRQQCNQSTPHRRHAVWHMVWAASYLWPTRPTVFYPLARLCLTKHSVLLNVVCHFTILHLVVTTRTTTTKKTLAWIDFFYSLKFLYYSVRGIRAPLLQASLPTVSFYILCEGSFLKMSSVL